MGELDHVLERRAAMLSAQLQKRKEILRNALAPPGERLPFTHQMTKAESLDFWTKHRHDATGAKILQNMKPDDIMELDRALATASMED